MSHLYQKTSVDKGICRKLILQSFKNWRKRGFVKKTSVDEVIAQTRLSFAHNEVCAMFSSKACFLDEITICSFELGFALRANFD